MYSISKILTVTLSVMISFVAICTGEVWTGNVNFSLGAKALEEDDWEPVEEHNEFGINIDFRQKEWPISIAIALVGSKDDESIAGYKFELSTTEVRFGAKKNWSPNQVMHPFLGGGLALLSIDVEVSDGSGKGTDDDSSIGIWLEGGIFWTLNNSFNIGFELGYSKGEVSSFGYDVDAGGGHAGLILGYHW